MKTSKQVENLEDKLTDTREKLMDAVKALNVALEEVERLKAINDSLTEKLESINYSY